MGNTNSEELDERLSAWGVSLADSKPLQNGARGHQCWTPRDELEQKLSTWAVKLPDHQERGTSKKQRRTSAYSPRVPGQVKAAETGMNTSVRKNSLDKASQSVGSQNQRSFSRSNVEKSDPNRNPDARERDKASTTRIKAHTERHRHRKGQHSRRSAHSRNPLLTKLKECIGKTHPKTPQYGLSPRNRDSASPMHVKDSSGKSLPKVAQNCGCDPQHASHAELKGCIDKQLTEKLSPWGVKLGDEGFKEDRLLTTKLNRGGSDENIECVLTLRELQERLMTLGIYTETIKHSEVCTEEQSLSLHSPTNGIFAKTFFLQDKTRKLYLFCFPKDACITPDALARLVNASGGLRPAESNLVEKKLGCKHGVLPVFGLMNDQFHEVNVVIDYSLAYGTHNKILFHSKADSTSVAMTPAGLRSFLLHTGHKPVFIDVYTHSTVV